MEFDAEKPPQQCGKPAKYARSAVCIDSPETRMNKSIARRLMVLAGLVGATGTAAWLAGCQSAPGAPPLPAPAPTPQAGGSAPAPAPSPITSTRNSSAATPKAYREDAAIHLYGLNRDRIYQGKLPPLLYAIGVLEVNLNDQGKITGINWLRAPRHAPEVMAEIERTVRAAAPYPAPARLGKVTYTDTWLWHKSGQFQLDTLTEGQM
jgi:protein TonB